MKAVILLGDKSLVTVTVSVLETVVLSMVTSSAAEPFLELEAIRRCEWFFEFESDDDNDDNDDDAADCIVEELLDGMDNVVMTETGDFEVWWELSNSVVSAVVTVFLPEFLSLEDAVERLL